VERASPGPLGGGAGRGAHCPVAGGDLAGGKRTAADLGAWLVFEDESGQGLRPPEGRTWGRRGQTPVVKVTGAGNKRVSLAALIAIKPECRPRLIYSVHAARGPPAASDQIADGVPDDRARDRGSDHRPQRDRSTRSSDSPQDDRDLAGEDAAAAQPPT
jgi:hypothetical protein